VTLVYVVWLVPSLHRHGVGSSVRRFFDCFDSLQFPSFEEGYNHNNKSGTRPMLFLRRLLGTIGMKKSEKNYGTDERRGLLCRGSGVPLAGCSNNRPHQFNKSYGTK